MRTSAIANARDYNRGLPLVIRWVHLLMAAVAPPIAAVWRWANEERRRLWAPALLVAAVLFMILLPLDGPISRALRQVRLGGDVRRELEAIQQYGQGISTLLIALVIWLQDPARRRRLADWATALVACGLIVNVTKMGVGRPRPLYDDPWVFLGPFGQYPIGPGKGVHHAWEIWADISSRLWSMPSSHTAYAVVMAIFIGSVYPRLRWLALGIAAAVGLGRVLTNAHYPTDVVVGAAIGLVVARVAIERRWGEALLALAGSGKKGTAESSSVVAPPPESLQPAARGSV